MYFFLLFRGFPTVVKIFLEYKIIYVKNTVDKLKIFEFQTQSHTLKKMRNNCFPNTLRSLINVQSLITVQGVTLFYKKLKVSSGLGLFPFPRDSKKSKFSHLEIYLVVLEQLTGL